MKFETYAHNQSDLGALMRYSVPTSCVIDMDTLLNRLSAIGLASYAPRKRAYSDALRLAFASITEKSVRETYNGGTTSLVIVPIPKRKDDYAQRWAVHRQTRDRANQVVAYTEIGYAHLYENDSMTVPPEIMEVGDIHKMVQGFIYNADHTKIRETIRSIVQSVAKPIPLNGISFIASDKIDFLKSRVEPVFNNLDAGEVTFSLYEIANTPGNVQSLKQEITASISDEIDKIRAGIMKAKEDNSLQKSTVADWLKTIDILKSNMDSMGVLNVRIPDGIANLEAQIAVLKSEVEKPKSKRVLHSL